MGNTYKERRPKTWADEDGSEGYVEPRPIVKENYETTNLSLATVLSLKFDLKEVAKGQVSIRYGKNFTPAIFIFNKTDELLKAIDDYFSAQSLVEPIAFYRQLQNLRSRTHELLST